MIDISTTTIWTILKNGSYIPVFIIGAGISVETFNALAFLIILDTVTGVIKSGVVYGWPSIKSKTMASGIIAKLVLIIVPVSLATLAHGLQMDISAIITASLTVLMLSETYSILGNIHAIKTKKEVPEFDAVNIILKKINQLLSVFIK